MSGVVQLIYRAGGNLCSLQVFVCNVKSPFLARAKWVSPLMGWGLVFYWSTSFLLKQSRFFRIICVCRGGQCVLCLAGYSLPAGSSVSLWTRFLLKPQLTRYLWDTWLLLWRHFESSPLSLTRQVLLLALHLQTGAAFCAFFFCIQMLVIRPCCPYCCLHTFLPAFPKAVFQSLRNTWFKHPSSLYPLSLAASLTSGEGSFCGWD